MRVVFTQPEESAAAWREHDRKVTRARLDASKPSVVMADEAAALLDRRERIFRGRSYRVPPIPWPLAVRLLECREQIERMAAGGEFTVQEQGAVFVRAVALMRKAVQPNGRLARLLWPITRNPFRLATPFEVGELLGFFCMCLMLDGGGPLPQVPVQHGTSRSTSRPSSLDSLAGRMRQATRSRGRIL